MFSIKKFSSQISALAMISTCFIFNAYAQEANVLGLPAVPQPKPGAAASAPGAASKLAKPTDSSPNRDVLAGEMSLQHSALNGLGRLVMTTKSIFNTQATRGNAIDAARLVQRDLTIACGKQCKPEKMASPKILSSGQLEFELAFSPLYQHLNQAQFLAALQSKPINLTPAQLSLPSQPALPAIVSGATTSTQAIVKTTTQ